jgi:signal transduction histidine kinase
MLMPEEMRTAHLYGFERYLRTGRKGIPWPSVELPGRHKSGEVFPMEMSIGEFEAKGRRIFTGIARDISARKRAAAEIEHQKAAAEAANQVKDNFLAMLSHELRTPLSPVISAIDDLSHRWRPCRMDVRRSP